MLGSGLALVLTEGTGKGALGKLILEYIPQQIHRHSDKLNTYKQTTKSINENDGQLEIQEPNAYCWMLFGEPVFVVGVQQQKLTCLCPLSPHPTE